MSKPNNLKALKWVAAKRMVPAMQALAMPELDWLLEHGYVEFASGYLRATDKGKAMAIAGRRSR